LLSQAVCFAWRAVRFDLWRRCCPPGQVCCLPLFERFWAVWRALRSAWRGRLLWRAAHFGSSGHCSPCDQNGFLTLLGRFFVVFTGFARCFAGEAVRFVGAPLAPRFCRLSGACAFAAAAAGCPRFALVTWLRLTTVTFLGARPGWLSAFCARHLAAFHSSYFPGGSARLVVRRWLGAAGRCAKLWLLVVVFDLHTYM